MAPSTLPTTDNLRIFLFEYCYCVLYAGIDKTKNDKTRKISKGFTPPWA